MSDIQATPEDDVLEKAFAGLIEVEKPPKDLPPLQSDAPRMPWFDPGYRQPALPDKVLFEEVELQPWGGPVRARLNSQAKDFRRRIAAPGAFVLGHRFKNYSAKTFFGVVWLYLKLQLKQLFRRR